MYAICVCIRLYNAGALCCVLAAMVSCCSKEPRSANSESSLMVVPYSHHIADIIVNATEPLTQETLSPGSQNRHVQMLSDVWRHTSYVRSQRKNAKQP